MGSVSPITVPNGINPVFKPSINIANPIITATSPKDIVPASAMGCLKISIWNKKDKQPKGPLPLLVLKFLRKCMALATK